MQIMIISDKEIELMRESGRILAKVLKELEAHVRPGVSTLEIDRICYELIKSHGCTPSFLNYNGFPASICVSINDEVVHGIPDRDRIIKEGDIVSLDCGVIYEGYHSDAARTIPVERFREAKSLSRSRSKASLRASNMPGRACTFMTYRRQFKNTWNPSDSRW